MYKKWDYESVKKIALKCKSKSEFAKFHGAYHFAIRKGIYDEITKHMIRPKPKFKYSYSFVVKEAAKYNKIKHCPDWLQMAIYRRKLEDQLFPNRKKTKNWTYIKLKKEALKYKTKIDFQKGNKAAYEAARRNVKYDDICAHMKSVGKSVDRCIYACLFPDKSVYIGLTCDFYKRKIGRSNCTFDSVTRYKAKTGLDYTMVQITDYINDIKASEMERFYVEEYSKRKWNILNKNRAGGLGYT